MMRHIIRASAIISYQSNILCHAEIDVSRHEANRKALERAYRHQTAVLASMFGGKEYLARKDYLTGGNWNAPTAARRLCSRPCLPKIPSQVFVCSQILFSSEIFLTSDEHGR